MDPEVTPLEPQQNKLQPSVASDPPPPAPEPEVADPNPEPPQPDVEGNEHGNKGKTPWFLQRISETTERARIAEQRAADAEALLARGNGANQPPGNTPAANTNPNSPDFQNAVRQEAARIRLSEDSTAIRDSGLKDYGASFSDALNVLNAVGATSDDVVQDLIAADKTNAHKIIVELAKDPERAASLAGMDSRRRIAELTRMSMSASVPAAQTAPKPAAATPGKQVSRAPAPPPPVEPSASKIIDGYADAATDDQFTAQFNERMKARAGRR